jgi:hypothetical protein
MIDAQVGCGTQRFIRDQSIKRRCVETVCIAFCITAAAWLAGCTVSYHGEASTGSSIEAGYGAQWPESDPYTERSGIRHGAFTGDQ